MSFIVNRGTQNLDPFKHLDSPEPNFELTGREERNARVNEGTFKLGGGAMKASHLYELAGKHSVKSQGDVIDKPVDYSLSGHGRHNAKREL